jgi:hypothetical protein
MLLTLTASLLRRLPERGCDRSGAAIRQPTRMGPPNTVNAPPNYRPIALEGPSRAGERSAASSACPQASYAAGGSDNSAPFRDMMVKTRMGGQIWMTLASW